MRISFLEKFLLLALFNGINNCNRESFKSLYELYYGDLLAMIRFKVNHKETAEDLLQEVFLAFIRILQTKRLHFTSDVKMKNYLVTIAMNKVRDHFRVHNPKQQKQLLFKDKEELNSFLEQLPAADNPEQELLDQEQSAKAESLTAYVMSLLPPRYAEVLELKFTRNLDNPQIAQTLGIGIKAVESLLFRARAAFKKQFEKKALQEEFLL